MAQLEDKINSKIYDISLTNITINTHLLNVSLKSKSNQAMKFGGGEVIEYNQRNVFFSKTMHKLR